MMNCKDLEESGSGNIKVLSRHFPGGPEENHDELQSQQAVSGLKLELSTS
jgi:hypothetical protein